MLMKRGVQDLPEYKKAMLSTRIRPYLLVPTLRMARYSLFTAAVAEAAGLTNAADVSVDLRLLASMSTTS
jgi:hypothetical protein